MRTYDETTYGDLIAEQYDRINRISPQQTQAAADALAELAKNGPALELGIGTGRVALPLREKGIAVHGIDASSLMIEELRKKPGGDAIPVTVGNFGDVAVEEKFSLIYVVFNTFFALLTQEEQVQCFANVASHLLAGGVFVIEAFVPDLSRFTRNQNMVATNVGVDGVRFDVSMYDPMHQRVDSQHVIIANGSIQTYPVQLRYAWPSELDLMAQLAGLKLCERWSNWQRSPFASGDGAHISLYQQA
ncbi:class I SAM-dependent methyltransferase [Acidobacterium sp. S8]|uniref:class I SAM-dependent DNA methyltransferase n=1 Tax=Acidobacterium sp. S8 TaxID=1641854 RepID=UPI00131BD0FE|nr:class I SAM-dependent methyltransferase [Acidobacterium sp. S8]